MRARGLGAWAVTEKAVLFDEVGDWLGHECFPAAIAGLNFGQHIAAADADEVRIEMVDALDEPVFEQIGVEMHQARRHRIILSRDEFARIQLEVRVMGKAVRLEREHHPGESRGTP